MSLQLPLRFEFDRDPKEHVKAHLESSKQFQPKTFLLFLFLGASIPVLSVGLEMLGVPPFQIGSGLVTLLVCFILFFVFMTFFSFRMAKNYELALRAPIKMLVQVDEEIISTHHQGKLLESQWQNIDDIMNLNGILILRDELLVHYIPARAIPDSVSVVDLHKLIQSLVTSAKAVQT